MIIAAIKYFDCFSGIGGFRSGLEQAGGYECVGFCEIDKHAETAYRAMYNTEKEVFYHDITEIKGTELPDFDLFVGGFPCQPFSVAGKRLGFEDTRGTMFYHIARILETKHPAAFLLENVPGLLSHEGGKTFNTILSALSTLGYSIEWCLHHSADFGVPQSRRRVYIVGYLRTECAGKIFPIPHSAGKTPDRIIDGAQGSRVYSTNGTAVTQCAGSGGGGGRTGLYLIDMNPDAEITDNARCLIARYNSGITHHKGTNSGVLVECSNGQNEPLSANPENTISVADKQGILHRGRVRRLMPLECWRLQGFSDEQFNKAVSTGLSDGHLYKMAGNAVSVPVIAAIGKRIREVIFNDTT